MADTSATFQHPTLKLAPVDPAMAYLRQLHAAGKWPSFHHFNGDIYMNAVKLTEAQIEHRKQVMNDPRDVRFFETALAERAAFQIVGVA